MVGDQRPNLEPSLKAFYTNGVRGVAIRRLARILDRTILTIEAAAGGGVTVLRGLLLGEGRLPFIRFV
jgi:hypothetical protein